MNLEALEDDECTDDEGLNDGVLSEADDQQKPTSRNNSLNSKQRKKSKSAGPSNSSRRPSKVLNDSLMDASSLASNNANK
jgi:hypothetical protein